MSELRKNIPHIPMPRGSAMCGAACLKMLLTYYGRTRDMNTIWGSIKGRDRFTGRENCRTYKMVQYAQQAGLWSAAVTCDDPLRLIDICLQGDIGMAIMYRPDLSSPYAHFSVVIGKDDNAVYVNDPEMKASKGAGLAIPSDELAQRMERVPGAEIGKSYTFVLVGRTNLPLSGYTGVLHFSQEQKSFSLPSCLDGLPLCALCLDNDQWFASISRIDSSQP